VERTHVISVTTSGHDICCLEKFIAETNIIVCAQTTMSLRPCSD